RHSIPPCKGAVFADAKRPCRSMTTEFLDSLILVAVIYNGTVVAAKDHQSLLIEFQFVQDLEDFSRGPVKLDNGITPRAHAGLSNKAPVRDARHVDIMSGEIEEKRSILVVFDEGHCLACDDVCHLLIYPARCLATRHEANTTDAIDDGLVVFITGMYFEKFRVFPSCRVISDGPLITHLN